MSKTSTIASQYCDSSINLKWYYICAGGSGNDSIEILWISGHPEKCYSSVDLILGTFCVLVENFNKHTNHKEKNQEATNQISLKEVREKDLKEETKLQVEEN